MTTSSIITLKKTSTVRKLVRIWTMTILGLGFATGAAQAISITPTNSGEDLVDSILGEGIEIPEDNTITYTGADGASGLFTNGKSSGIGIDEGIIMTSGQAADAVGPNTSDATSTSNGTAGDSDLDALIPQNTQDAVVLEFDFESDGGDLYFNYVFASEEYNEFTNSTFNDVFAFFLDGENIALIPGTTTPVAINTVNGGNPFGTDASNPDLYNNNSINDPGPAEFDLEYDGFTDVFTASAKDIGAGVHTMKLVLADAGDSALDSAVFIEAGSFTNEPEVIPEPTSMFGVMALAYFGAGSYLKRKKQ